MLSQTYRHIGEEDSPHLSRLIRLKHAAHLLSQGKYNVREVADKTSFNDAKYFREVIKKYYKVSPRAYGRPFNAEPTERG